MDLLQFPEYMVFDLMEEYATYLYNYPKFIVPKGSIYVFRIRQLDAIWIKVGDGKNALIDLPHIVAQ